MSISITTQYKNLLNKIIEQGNVRINQRTGVRVRECLSPTLIDIPLGLGGMSIPGWRKMYPYVAAAETAWQLMGTREVDFINKYAPKLWSKFVEPTTNIVENAYGYRWAKHFDRNQIMKAVWELETNPSSRQTVVSMWDPRIDGLGTISRTTPCLPMMILGVDLFGGLFMTVLSRSSDVVVGLPYDIMNYSFLHTAIAKEADINPGTLTLVLTNQHVYCVASHTTCVEYILHDSSHIDHYYMIPPFAISDIIANPDKYVNWVKTNMKMNHEFAPELELIL